MISAYRICSSSISRRLMQQQQQQQHRRQKFVRSDNEASHWRVLAGLYGSSIDCLPGQGTQMDLRWSKQRTLYDWTISRASRVKIYLHFSASHNRRPNWPKGWPLVGRTKVGKILSPQGPFFTLLPIQLHLAPVQNFATLKGEIDSQKSLSQSR